MEDAPPDASVPPVPIPLPLATVGVAFSDVHAFSTQDSTVSTADEPPILYTLVPSVELDPYVFAELAAAFEVHEPAVWLNSWTFVFAPPDSFAPDALRNASKPLPPDSPEYPEPRPSLATLSSDQLVPL
jgi:hypothetical protein